MGRKSALANGPGCNHARLQAFAAAFVAAWQGADPVEDARSLGLAAGSWTPAKRRRAIAARIALLSQRGGGAALNPSAAALPPSTAGQEKAAQGGATDGRARPPPEVGRSARQRPPPATIGTASAAGLLAEMAAQDHAPDRPEAHDQEDDSRRLDLRNTGPLDRAGRAGSGDVTTWTQDPSGSQSGESGAQLESRMRDIDESAGPVAKKITMTDLSLAILTGDFGGQENPDEMAPSAVADEEAALGQGPAAETPVVSDGAPADGQDN